MRTNNASLLLTATAAIATLITACKKDLDTPPEQSLAEGSVITLDSLRNLFTGLPMHFDTTDWSVYATVTADETNGNLYKEVYVQDGDAAINVRLLASGGLYQGDRIRIHLPGTVLSSYNGMLQLDSVDVDVNVVKQDVDVVVPPEVVTIAGITPAIQGHLIRLDSVEFIDAELGLPYSDAIGQTSVNRTLHDCGGDVIIVRSSGYANFAALTVPSGRGSFTAVVGQFGSTMQLYIRDLNEVLLTGIRCDGSTGGLCPATTDVQEDFASVVQYDPISIPCWKNLPTAGTAVWEGGSFSGTSFARCEAYNSGEPVNVMWLTTPPVTYAAGMNLSFITEKAYWTHDPFAVFISTDFDGTNAGTATWTPIPCTHAVSSDVDYTWVPSGNIDLAPYLPLGGDFVIGFRYSGGDGTTPQTTRYDIDDVVIQ